MEWDVGVVCNQIYIYYLRVMELVKTIRMTKGRSWFRIYKVWEKYELYVFNLAWEYELDQRFDSIKWAKEYCKLIKPKY